MTLLFTDIEGSTRLLQDLGAERFAEVLAAHRAVIRDAVSRFDGLEVDTQGDAFFIAFASAEKAVAAAADAQRRLADGPVRVRMGLHTGEPYLADGGYVGEVVHLGARIGAVAHGGQVLVSAATRQLVAVDVRDLGEHRLKDFSEPVPLFQLGEGVFPPLKTISNTNLPRPASSFVGRAEELEAVRLLLRGSDRIVSLTGPGGSGKTRLAIEAAAEVVPEFKAGVFWVPLAPLHNASLVLPTIAQTLGAQDALAETIGDREMLLLLDNFEQVVAAAPDISALVRACPNLRVLATTRELLCVDGEAEFPVLPLAEDDAVLLFAARSGVGEDEAVRNLCRALENLPLALELAAARIRVLSPEQILERIAQRLDLLKGGRDADPRQQTLRATIAWSHDLLDESEKRLFARLAVFRGGFDVRSAETIACADLDAMQSLVEKSLLRRVGGRYWMFETIREYAAERLEESADVRSVPQLHARHFLAFAEEAEPHLWGNPGVWLDRLDADVDNLRAALDFFEEARETQLALRLAGSMARFWMIRGNVAEGMQRLERLLQRDEAPTAARATALAGAAITAANSGEHQLAARRAEEARELWEQLGDRRGAAYATHMLGFSAGNQNEHAAALAFFEEAERAFEELGETHRALLAADGIAWAVGSLGDDERRRNLHEEILRRAREVGDKRIEALTLGQLASFAFEDGRLADAVALMDAQYAIHRDHGDRRSFGEDLCRLGGILAEVQQYEAAAQVAAHSQHLCEHAGGTGSRWVDTANAETLKAAGASLGEDALCEVVARGRRLSTDEAFRLAVRVLSAQHAAGNN